MKLLALAFALAITLTLAACTGLDVPDEASPSSQAPAATPVSETEPEPTATPEPSEPAGDAPAGEEAPEAAADDLCGGSLEGCFSYDEMDDYLAAITPMVAQFFETAYADVPAPRDIVLIPDDRAAQTFCGVSTDTAYEYCTANQTIYIGQDLLWAFYQQAGDAAPAVALAHEWGHHLQYMLGVPFAPTRTGAIDFENQADCVSGAWARFAGEQEWLEDDDLDDVSLLLQLIGARESRARDHGTTEERAAAFQAAYEEGIAACNAYFPDDPIA